MDYKARFYDPYLNRWTQPDSIINPGPQGLNRYSYVSNNPVNNIDPTGCAICADDDTECLTKAGAGEQLMNYYNGDIGSYGWNLKGSWDVHELKTISDTGHDIEKYVDGITGGKGLAWMNKYLGGATFSHSGLPGLSRNHVEPGNLVVLQPGWNNYPSNAFYNPYQTIVHELGHVWDNNSNQGMGTYLGGGLSDALNMFIGGNISTVDNLGGPFAGMFFRFINPSKKNYSLVPLIIPKAESWQGNLWYGNAATADYFADTFGYNVTFTEIYGSSYINQIPQKAYLWVNAAIGMEGNNLP